MAVKQRDRIVIDSDKAGTPAREGEILEVIEADYGTRYRVAWDDGHESTDPTGRRQRPRRPSEGTNGHEALTRATPNRCFLASPADAIHIQRLRLIDGDEATIGR